MYQQGQGAKEMALEISFTYVAVLRLFYHLQSGDKTSDPPLQNKLKSSQRYAKQFTEYNTPLDSPGLSVYFQ